MRRWLASGDAITACTARRTLRGAKRLAGRLRSGSLSAEMDRIVADALDTTRGSGSAIPTPEVSRRRRAERGTHGHAPSRRRTSTASTGEERTGVL